MKDRADKVLHDLKIFESRKKAQVAIEKGLVTLIRGKHRQKISKVSQTIEFRDGDTWEITPDAEFAFVSRAGAKLQGALEHFKIDVTQKICLDVGVSTGGFSQCLLENGAGFVIGVDVGTGQLHPALAKASHFLSFEKINAKDPLPSDVISALKNRLGTERFDLMVFDVSFISLLKVLEPQLQFLHPDGQIVALIKPQFEGGREILDKKGVVAKDDGLRVVEKTVKKMDSLSLNVLGVTESTIKGEDGNQEYFVHARL